MNSTHRTLRGNLRKESERIIAEVLCEIPQANIDTEVQKDCEFISSYAHIQNLGS